jgi:hypothetical protein
VDHFAANVQRFIVPGTERGYSRQKTDDCIIWNSLLLQVILKPQNRFPHISHTQLQKLRQSLPKPQPENLNIVPVHVLRAF